MVALALSAEGVMNLVFLFEMNRILLADVAAIPGNESPASRLRYSRQLIERWHGTIGVQSDIQHLSVILAEQYQTPDELLEKYDEALSVEPANGRLWLARAQLLLSSLPVREDAFSSIRMSILIEPHESMSSFLRTALIIQYWGLAPPDLKFRATANLKELTRFMSATDFHFLGRILVKLDPSDREDFHFNLGSQDATGEDIYRKLMPK